MPKKRKILHAPLMALGIAIGVLLLYIGCTYVYSAITQAITTPKTPAKTESQSLIDVKSTDAVQDGSTIDSTQSPTQQPVQPVRLIMSVAPIFDDAQSKGSLNIINHPDNKDLLMQVTITNATTGDILYISPSLEPEQKIETDYLINQDLPADNYEAIATFDFYKQFDKSHYFSAATGITIRIKN